MTTYTPEQIEANRRAWIAALRSGEWKQTRFGLHREDRHCCLGVADKIGNCGATRDSYEPVAEWLGMSYFDKAFWDFTKFNDHEKLTFPPNRRPRRGNVLPRGGGPMKHFLADTAATLAGKAPDTGLGTALRVLAKSEPFTAYCGKIRGDLPAPILVGDTKEAEWIAKLCNACFQRGVSRAIEAIG